jgi:acyl-homoserine-lactone acylase
MGRIAIRGPEDVSDSCHSRMVSMPKRLRYLVLLLLVPCPGFAQPNLGEQAVIRRDIYGVPHILAQTEQAAAFAHGYATAEDHLTNLAGLFLRARAEQASVFGESFIADDLYMHQLGIHEVAEARFAGLPPLIRSLLESYAAGYNLFLAQHRDRAPKWATSVTGVDVLAHCRAVLLVDFRLIDRGLWRNEPRPAQGMGSNMWAIGKERSASGKGILLANPHLPWKGSLIFQEVQITVPGRINVSGATLIGFPVIGMGFNDFLGWSHTINQSNADTVYELSLDPADQTHYLYDGQSLPITSRIITIQVKHSSGIEIISRTLLMSHYGPVIRVSGKSAFALKSANLDDVDFLTQWNLMGKARSLSEFRAALNLQALPLFNIGYADRDGQIFYIFDGRIPQRPAGYHWGETVPGNSSDAEWYAMLPVADLPQLLNPKGGYIQNCNDPPWFVNLQEHPDPAMFPQDITRDMLGSRGQFSLDLLERVKQWDLDQVKRFKFDEHVIIAPRVKPQLIALLRNQVTNQQMLSAADLLQEWDNRASVESKAALLFVRWWESYSRQARPQFQTPWSPDDPLGTPSGLGDPKAALTALLATINQLQSKYGSISPTWGEVCRFRRGAVDLPVGGAPGCFRTIGYHSDQDGKAVGDFGDSYILAVEFTNPPTAYSVLSYSESSDPTSPHYTDQAELFTRGEFKRAWFTESEIRGHIERSYHPGQ